MHNITLQAIFFPFLSVQSRIVIQLQLFCLSSNLMVIVTLNTPNMYAGTESTAECPEMLSPLNCID